MLRNNGIVRKTFVFAALLITLVTLCSFAILYFTMPGFYQYKKAGDLERNLNALVSSLQTAGTQDECAGAISNFCESNNANIFSFGSDNTLLPAFSTPFISMRSEDGVFFKSGQEIGNEDSSYFGFTPGGGDGSRSSYTIIVQQRGKSDATQKPDGQKIAIRSFVDKSDGADNNITLRGVVGTSMVDYIVVSSTLQPIDEAKDVILSLMPYALAVAIVLGLFLAWIYARRISKPILRVSQAAVKMRRMEPGAESDIRSDDELGLLSRNLNDLYASLCKNIEDLRLETHKANRLERSKTEMMQSASHELKTPIAALSGMIEGMLDNVGVYRNKEKYLMECKGQIGKLSMLVDEILIASRSDMAGEGLELAEISLDSLAGLILEEYAVPARENGLLLEVSLAPVTVTADEAVLYRAISNLISNAVRYTKPQGEVRVSLSEDGDVKLLVIENQTDPIPEDELPKLFEPFYTRSYSRDREKSGTGLGLYIVRRNLERLGIPYVAENGELGFKITLSLQ